MTSGYSPDLLYGGGNSGRSSLSSASSLAGMSSFRQPQQQQQQPLSSQQQPQQGMMFEQIAQRRADLLMGKRSFGDYQAYQQQILLQQQQQQLQRQQQQQQQQQQNPLLFLQKQQQQQPQSHQQLSYLHQQYLMRSVKQRTNSFSSSPISPLSPSIDLCSPTSNNNTNNSLSSPSAARFGVPIYQQIREQQQQQTISLLSNNHIPNNNNNNFSNNNNNNNNNQFINNNQFNPTNKCLIPNLSTTTTNNNSLMIPIQNSGPGMSSRGYPNYGQNLFQPKPEPQTEAAGGYSNYGQNLVQPKPEPQPEAAGGYSNYGQNLVQPKLEPQPEAAGGYSNYGHNLVQPKLEPQPEAAGGYSNYGHNLVQPKLEPQPEAAGGYLNSVEPKVEPDLEDQKILDSLHELEKQLLNDDNDEENDDVSVITNSEWSETFQNLMSSSGSRNPNPNPSPGLSPSPSPNTNHACSSTSGSNNNVNNNNMISPSPTSSTSSCCSTSTPQPQQQPETLSVNQLISEAAAAIAENKGEPGISELLARLARISNSKGDNHQRLGFFMGHALRTRACLSETPAPVRELYSEDQMQAMYSLYNISPCFKFGLLAANLVMLEAITSALQEGSKVHVIDFEIGQGAQYINLLRALAERRSQVGAITEGGCSPYELKVTVVETELTNRGVMESVKDGLVKLASRVGIILKFEGLTRKITELTRESLGCEDGEAIVVNFAFRLYRIPDESVSMENLRDELLRRVKGLSPRAVTLVEQDMNGNTAPFMTRVNESCVYYGALFDSLEATLHREHKERIRVEEGLGRKMANSVACEGRERVERPEVFGKWRARMGMAGFELKAISPSVAESMRAKLNSARGGNPGFTVKEESGGVGFGWKGRTLTVASAWR